MTTRFFTQDAGGEQFDPDRLIGVLNEIGQWGQPFRAIEWDTGSDFYGIAITTDPELTPEAADELFHAWQRSDFDDEVLG